METKKKKKKSVESTNANDYPYVTNVHYCNSNMLVGYKTESEARAAFKFISNFYILIRRHDYTKSDGFAVTLFKLRKKAKPIEGIENPKFADKYERIDIFN